MTSDTTEQKSGGPSATEAVLEKIREKIEADGLGIGDPLPTELEIAKLFGTSRNTVREAISVLKAYGVVETRQRVGPVLVDKRQFALSKLLSFSQHISYEAFNDIQGFRRLIEEGVTEPLLELRTDEDVEKLEMFNARMEEADTVQVAAEQDYLFHLQLIKAAGNSTTVDVYRFLEPFIRRLLENGKSKATARADIGSEHRAIIDAVRDRDSYGYTYWINRHLKSGLKFIDDTPDKAG
ncbi:FadR/GntR family transcriptional regulator [Hoeflea sp.]|uniref:FadR/GntR family transcriptional regulator n=1 Tax=Hoeflea sp. TaxID=1940281 RepID=UPI003BB1FFC3